MYHVHLTEAERAELQHRSRTTGLASRTRVGLEMVHLADAGWSSPRIARHLRMSEARVRFWIKRYLAAGFDALPDQPHLGQQSALTPAIQAAVKPARFTCQRSSATLRHKQDPAVNTVDRADLETLE